MAIFDVDKEDAKLDAQVAKYAADREKALAAENKEVQDLLDADDLEQEVVDVTGEAGTGDVADDLSDGTEADIPEADSVGDADDGDLSGDGDPDAGVADPDAVALTTKQQKQVKDFQRKMTKLANEKAELVAKNDQMQKLIMDGQLGKREPEVNQKRDEDLLKIKADQKVADDEVKAEFDALRAELPEVAPILEKIVGGMRTRIRKLQSDLAASAQASAQSSQDSADIIFENTIEMKHKNFNRTIDSASFKEYVDSQAPMIQTFITDALDGKNGRGTPGDIIEILDSFATANGGAATPPAAKQTKLDAARQVASPTVGKKTKAVPLSKKPALTRAIISRMTTSEFAKREPEIDAWVIAQNKKG